MAQAAELRSEWGCPGDAHPGTPSALTDEARYAAQLMGVEGLPGCPLRDAIHADEHAREVSEAAMLMGEGFSPEAWRAILGREPSAPDVEAMLLLRRAQAAVRRSDDKIREAAEASRKRSVP